MKVLFLHKSHGEFFRLQGFARVMAACGHSVLFWDKVNKPAQDIFDEFKPDLFIGTTFDFDRETASAFLSRPETKLILKAGDWGKHNDSIDTSKYPVVLVSEKEKHFFAKFKELTGKPDFVFCHYHQNDLERTMGGWDSIGIKQVALPNAADTFVYINGKEKDELKSDISFVGGNWGYKGQQINKYMLPILNPVGKYNVKIWGNQGWNLTPQFMGMINDETVKDVFASAKICPSFSEPHSVEFGWDIIERPLKILSSGGFCISDRVESFEKNIFTNDSLPFFDSPEEFREMVDYFLKNPDKREEYKQKGRSVVLQEHTYWHRVRDLFIALNDSASAKHLCMVMNEYIHTI